MRNIEIPIRSVQHYLYCAHRWGLLEIGNVWAENAFVTKANLAHERVHNIENSYVSKNKKVFCSVWVYNDLKEYNLYGVTDCIEAHKNKNGISLQNCDSKYQLCIVEYKPTKPKNKDYNDEDIMQIFAQKICVDYVFKCDCNAEIYYADVKRRVKLPLKEKFSEYDNRLKILLKEMRYNLENGIIPKINKKQYCGGCSLKDLCMPSIKNTRDLRLSIKEIGEKEL